VAEAGKPTERSTAKVNDGALSTASTLFWLSLVGATYYVLGPPYAQEGWYVLHPIIWIIPISVFSKLRPGRAFCYGLFLGTVANIAIYEWLIETLRRFTEIPVLGVYAFLVVYSIAAGLVIAVFAMGVAPLRRASGSAWPFAVAGWMVVCEHWIPQFFPYAQGGVWISLPSIFLVAAHTGIAGVSFLALLPSGFAVMVYELARGTSATSAKSARRSAGVGIAVFVLAITLAAHQEARISQAEAEASVFRIALVQDSLERAEVRALLRADRSSLTEFLVRLSDEALQRDPEIDVVMWSEGALRSAPDTASGLPAREFSERSGVEVWTGALTRDSRSGKPTVYNSVYRIRDGEVSLPYHKNYLVPISEQMPFSGWLPSLHQLTGAAVGTGGLSAGTELGVFDTDWARVGFVICYEAILDTPTRDSVNAGADLLANFTYEAWFGNTRELDLHLQMAQGQAAQLGVPMVRVATIGITAIIDARGRVVQSGGRFTEEVLVGDVQPLRAVGLYAALGPWFAWLCTATSAALLIRGRGARGSPSNGSAQVRADC